MCCVSAPRRFAWSRACSSSASEVEKRGFTSSIAVVAALRQRAASVVTGVADRAEPTVMVKNGNRPAVELEDGGDLKEELGLVAEAVPHGHGTHPLGAV